MSITRRTVFSAIPACGVAAIVPAGAMALVAHDPLLDAINALRAALKDFCNNAPNDNEGAATYATVSYEPAIEVIVGWSAPAVTWKGAIEAIRLASEEATNFADSEMVKPLLSAALAYFDGGMQS